MRAALSEIERDGQLRMSAASSKLVHPVVHPEFLEVTSPCKTDCWNSGPSDCGSGAPSSTGGTSVAQLSRLRGGAVRATPAVPR